MLNFKATTSLLAFAVAFSHRGKTKVKNQQTNGIGHKDDIRQAKREKAKLFVHTCCADEYAERDMRRRGSEREEQ